MCFCVSVCVCDSMCAFVHLIALLCLYVNSCMCARILYDCAPQQNMGLFACVFVYASVYVNNIDGA